MQCRVSDEMMTFLFPAYAHSFQLLVRVLHWLREALRDSAEQPRFIETLPRRGYRLIAEGVPVEAALPEKQPVPRRIRRNSIIVATLLAAGILAGAFAARKFWATREPRFQQLT